MSHATPADRRRRRRRWRLLYLIVRFWWLLFLHRLRLYRPYPYRPFRPPTEYGGGTAVGIGTVDGTMTFHQRQKDSGSTAWSNMCESLARQGYALPAMYSSAEDHYDAIPSTFRHGHEAPSAGDVVVYANGGYGHIATCRGGGWSAWTNDYGGKGKVSVCSDLRDMVAWCGADAWYVADAWWRSDHYRQTHNVDDAPPPTGALRNEDDVLIKYTDRANNNKVTYWLLHAGRMTNIPSDDIASWTGARISIDDTTTWDRLTTGYPTNRGS